MRILFLALFALAGIASAQISALSLPHTIDSAAIPKLSYVDDNDVALKNKLNTAIDSINADSVRTRIQSLGSLRLTIDADNNATGTCVAMTHNGSADTIAKFCDDLAVKAYGKMTVTDSIIGASLKLSGLTINLPVFTGANKELVSNAMTGTGSVVMSASPTLTGTMAAANGTFSGTTTTTGVATFTAAPVFSSATASLPMFTDGSKALVSNAMTGTGSVMMSVSPASTGTATFVNSTNSGTQGVTGLITATGDIRAVGGTSPSAVGSWLTGEALYLNRTGGTSAIVWMNGSGANGWTMQRNTPATGNLVLQANSLTGESSRFHVRNSGGGTATAIFDTENGRVAIGSNTAPTVALDVTGAALISGALGVTGATTLSSTATTTGVHTFTAAPVFTSATASLPMFTDGSKGLVSNAMTGTGSVAMSVSPAFTGTATFVNTTNSGTSAITGNLTVNTNAISVDATNKRLGIGITSPAASLHGIGSNAVASRIALFQTGLATGGATNDYVDVLFRHVNSVGSAIDGASIRSVVVDPTTGVRTSKIGLYGSNNEVQTLGLEVNPAGSVRIMGTNATASRVITFQTGLTTGGAAADYADVLFRHVNSVGSAIDGASIRSVVVDPAGGVRTSKLALYGSNNEVQTLGLEVAANGAVTMPVTLGVTGVTTATGGLTLGARFVNMTTTLSSNTTLSLVHSAIFADATSGTVTLTLPAASGNTGLTYTIYKTDASANTVIVDGSAAETINGALTQTLAGNTGDSRIVIICTGTTWKIQELYDEGTFTATYVGGTTSPTGTASFIRIGKSVTLLIPVISATSNSVGFSFTGLPVVIQPPTAQYFVVSGMADNGTVLNVPQLAQISNSTSMVFRSGVTSGGNWTSSGTKSVSTAITITYTLQ